MADNKLISQDPTIRFGKACLNGTRIAVTDVKTWLSQGLRPEEIMADFPALKAEHIQACLQFQEN
ncbi:MAG: DUF433 domain-containing protein [Bacteroidota bacterium]